VLQKRVLSTSQLVEVATVTCSANSATPAEPETGNAYALVIVRRGYFRRRINGLEALLDATCAYVQRPGEEQTFSHPHDGGDVCTMITLAPKIVPGEVLEADSAFDRIPTANALEVAHRQLVAACTAGIDASELLDGTLALTNRLLPGTAAPAAGRSRATHERQRRLVDAARELLNVEPATTLPSLAHELGVSPRHLSRLFPQHVGMTLSKYRNALRTRTALEAIAAGAPSLARLAAELGFADQAHLTRTVHRLTGRPPSAHRTRASLDLATAHGQPTPGAGASATTT
jgi:AraC-like DNA-binding protein